MKVKEGDVDSGYDETYFFGNTIVHIVAPKSKTPEEIDKILEKHHKIGWEIWNELLKEKKAIKKIND